MTTRAPLVTALTVSKRKKSPGRAWAESTPSSISTATTVHGSRGGAVAGGGVAPSARTHSSAATSGDRGFIDVTALARTGGLPLSAEGWVWRPRGTSGRRNFYRCSRFAAELSARLRAYYR